MSIIADLHLHSRYSRAVSQKMDLNEIASWGLKKGIHLVATGDWTHPLWFREIKAKLKETAPGIYSLKKPITTQPLPPDHKVRFILSTEISNIYSQNGQVRRVHNLIFSPSISTCEKVIKELQKKGAKLMSDGRPVLGMSSKDLLELLLNINQDILFIPAHIWTPWFSLFGSKSGFNSIKECFGSLEKYIYGIETGLSSDPIMNWQIDELRNRSIVSFSDAHSGPKLGREATVFICTLNHKQCNPDYFDLVNAIKGQADSHLKIGYTIEFFPEEGKYHWSGHRNCGVSFSPQEIKKNGHLCPVCKKPLTIGVENRVNDLASQTLTESDLILAKNKHGVIFVYDKKKKRKPFVSLIPLLEILLEINNNSPTKAKREYEKLTSLYGTEFDLLLRKDLSEIEQFGGKKLREAIQRVRERKVFVKPGFDGLFGTVKIFPTENEYSQSEQTKEKKNQLSLF